ncbi:MAG: hypothetical protein RL291_812, partial [Pseudomonadota bacterium]
DRKASGADLDQRLAAAGFGPAAATKPRIEEARTEKLLMEINRGH